MNGNHANRSKRKQHPGSVEERPQKQHRALNGKESAGDNTPEPVYDDEMDVEDSIPAFAGAPTDTAEWQATLEKVVSNVVSIRFCQTCSFDTDPALTSEATGFVVDAEKGQVSLNLSWFALLTTLQIYHDKQTCGGIGSILGILHIRQPRRS